jgi:hypothetical protein
MFYPPRRRNRVMMALVRTVIYLVDKDKNTIGFPIKDRIVDDHSSSVEYAKRLVIDKRRYDAYLRRRIS